MPRAIKATFSVQAFKEQGRALVPEPPQTAADEAHALRKVERLATGRAGAVAIRQDGDPGDGDATEPVVLRIIGRVPDAFLEHLPF